MATKDATWAYRDAHDEFARTYFRRCGRGVVSSIGLGTYLGDPTDEVDDGYRDAIVRALEGGSNVVDTAINYRHQRSERVVGEAIDRADVDRDAVFVSTKGGFVPFDEDRPDDPGAYVQSEYVDSGLVDPEDLVAGQHCIAPDYLDDQLDRSLENLGLDTVDCYYVHNPETQLQNNSADAVYDQLEESFTRLEERAADDDLRHYGLATWEAFRVPSDHESYLSLSEIISRARAAAKSAGNAATHFRALQLPFNVLMADAFTVEAQSDADGPTSVLWLAHEAGLNVFTSASLAQGRLAKTMPDAVADRLAGETTAQRALNFARSAPGVTCSLVGTSTPEHVDENIAAGTFEPLGADSFDAIFE
ncbi:aldo/keto reductase [Haloarculaceae archaeon H-GB2-1]|nr:aldo/keto reductase [Haloarculaceae archaeon H-GB1-1]MEA5387705.1 aldo/keto reductase [Haloarculaceae archaeon H-GB11]MEA5409195.1 aldo/keto reductase [Haloarculaceae archaeon H-GB2-1]